MVSDQLMGCLSRFWRGSASSDRGMNILATAEWFSGGLVEQELQGPITIGISPNI